MSGTSKASASKDKRNKIVLAGLAAVLVVILVIQGPTLMSAFGGGSSGEDTAEGTAEAAEGIPSGVSALPSTPVIPDSDIPQAATPSELTTISGFPQTYVAFDALVEETVDSEVGGVDPSTDLPGGDAPSGDAGSSSGEDSPDGDTGAQSGGDAASSGSGDSGSNGADDGTPDADPDNGIFTSGSGAVASLSINDITQDVVVGASFPSSKPVFKLVMIDGNAISVGLVNGAFSTGTTTIDVELGESRTLVSQPDGTRYRVKYAGRQGSSASAKASRTSALPLGAAG